jgi:hypothetical protein
MEQPRSDKQEMPPEFGTFTISHSESKSTLIQTGVADNEIRESTNDDKTSSSSTSSENQTERSPADTSTQLPAPDTTNQPQSAAAIDRIPLADQAARDFYYQPIHRFDDPDGLAEAKQDLKKAPDQILLGIQIGDVEAVLGTANLPIDAANAVFSQPLRFGNFLANSIVNPDQANKDAAAWGNDTGKALVNTERALVGGAEVYLSMNEAIVESKLGIINPQRYEPIAQMGHDFGQLNHGEQTELITKDGIMLIAPIAFGKAADVFKAATGLEAVTSTTSAAASVDKAMMETVQQTVNAINEVSRMAPEIAQQSKQMLYDYLNGKGLTGQELEYAGVPKDYFNGMQPSDANDSGILKMVGRSDDEYTPKPQPKFLRQGKMLNHAEVEKLGGVEKLEQMTDQQLQNLGIERFRLPTLKLKAGEFSMSASTPGINNALMTAVVPEKGTVILSYIKKGYLPDGTGAHFLAESLKAHDELPSNKLVLQSIISKETLAAFKNGVPAAETELGKFAIKAFKELGLTPKSIKYNWDPEIENLDIVIEAEK